MAAAALCAVLPAACGHPDTPAAPEAPAVPEAPAAPDGLRGPPGGFRKFVEMLPAGHPLADGVNDDPYECDSVRECWDKCPEPEKDGWSNTQVSRGQGPHTWSGRVTGTSSVHVAIMLGDSASFSDRTVTVLPRPGWTAEAMGLTGTATVNTRELNPKPRPWESGDWGRYHRAYKRFNPRHQSRERPVGGDELPGVDAEEPVEEGLPLRPSRPVRSRRGLSRAVGRAVRGEAGNGRTCSK